MIGAVKTALEIVDVRRRFRHKKAQFCPAQSARQVILTLFERQLAFVVAFAVKGIGLGEDLARLRGALEQDAVSWDIVVVLEA